MPWRYLFVEWVGFTSLSCSHLHSLVVTKPVLLLTKLKLRATRKNYKSLAVGRTMGEVETFAQEKTRQKKKISKLLTVLLCNVAHYKPLTKTVIGLRTLETMIVIT